MLHELKIKRAQFNNALAEALGLSIAANGRARRSRIRDRPVSAAIPETFRIAIPGQKFACQGAAP